MHFLCKGLYCSLHNLLTLDMANCRSCSVTRKWLQRCIPSSWLLPAVISATASLLTSPALWHSNTSRASPSFNMRNVLSILPSSLYSDSLLLIAFTIKVWTFCFPVIPSKFFYDMRCQNKSGKKKPKPSYKASYASVFMQTNKDGRNQRCLETSKVIFFSLPVSKY